MYNNEFEDINNLKTIKIFYNGVKFNGINKLYKMYMYLSNQDECIYLSNSSCYDYSMPDYFGTYRGKICLSTVKKDNPLYPFFYNNALKNEIKLHYSRQKRYIKRLENAAAEEEVAKINELTNMLLPITQPNEKDVENYKVYVHQQLNKVLEEERIEQEKEDAEREKVYQEKLSRRKLAIQLEKKFPIKENDKFYVKLGPSEHPGVEEKKMSLKAADLFLGYLDKEIHYKREIKEFWGWYDKTDFEIYDNNELVYIGRYDLGDGDCYNGRYGIAAHVFNFAKNPTANKQMMEFAKEILEAVRA